LAGVKIKFMTKIIQKYQKNTFIIHQMETKKKLIKAIVENWNYDIGIRWNASIKLYYFPSNSSKTCLIFKCILKGSKKGLNKFFHYSRQIFLKLVRFGAISGLKKACW
jgi:ribosomal protein S14